MCASSRLVGCELCVETMETTPSLCGDELDICCWLLEEGIASDWMTGVNGASLSCVPDVEVFGRYVWFEQFSTGRCVCAEPKGLVVRAGRDIDRQSVCSLFSTFNKGARG